MDHSHHLITWDDIWWWLWEVMTTLNGDNSCDGGTVAVSPCHQYLLSFIKMMGRRDLGCGSQLSSPVAITNHDPSHTHTHKHTRSSTALISHPHNWLLIGHNWRRSAQMSPECRMSPCVSVLESDTDSVVLSKHAELTPTLPIHGQHWNVIYTNLLLPQ